MEINRKMKGGYCFFVFLFLVCSSLKGFSQYIARAPRSFFFFVMSDTQFGMFTNNKGFTKETRNFEKAISAANRLHPAFIVICGDLVNQSANKAQISEYKRIVATLDPSIPLYNVPGNHDVGNIPTAGSLEYYRNNFGPDYYSFQYDDLYGIVLNSMLMSFPDRTPKESARQYAWLHSELKLARSLNYSKVIIFQHIPFFIHRPDEPTDYYSKYESRNIPLEQRKKYLDLFKQYGVKYIFAGHLHENAFGRDGNLEMITTSAVGRPLGKDPSGFRIVKSEGDKLSYPYYRLDSLPESIAVPRPQ